MICCHRLFIFLFPFFFVSLDAQQLITSYSVEEGLPQSTVMSLYRDNDGYLWCGTGAGLGLYDGWEFHKPVSDPKKPNPNLNSPVRGIIPSSDAKTVWVGTESVIMQFDRFNHRVLKSYDVVKQPNVGEIPVMANDTAVWVMCWGNGLFRLRISDGRVTQLTKDSFWDQHGITSDNTTVVFPDSTDHFTVYNLLNDKKSSIPRPEALKGVTIGFFMPRPGTKDEFIIATSIGLWRMNLSTATMERYLLGDAWFDNADRNVTAITSHPDGSWWIACYDIGLFRYDPVLRQVRPCQWQQDGTNVGDLLKAPKSIICDAYGVVWLATDGSGVVKVLHNRVTFRNKFTSPTVTDTCNWFIRSFYELSEGRYLVGTYRGGIKLIDETRNTISLVTSDPVWNQQTPFFITGGDNGRLLIGTENKILLLDTTTWQTTSVQTNSTSNERKYIGYLRLRTGRILVYGNQGMWEVLLGDAPVLSPAVGMLTNNTSAIELSDGRILVACYHEGIQELSAELKFTKFYPYDTHIGLSNATLIRGMYEDDAHMLWVGTENGLLQLSQDRKLIQTIGVNEGMPDPNIYDLAAYNNSTLIVTTGHGVVFMNMKGGIQRIYGAADGLPSEECNTGGLLLGKSGQVYIGTTEGFVHWNPEQTPDCYRIATVLASFDGSDPEHTGIIRESIERDYGSGSVDLRIWLTDFAFPELAMYTYQLEGASTEKINERGLRKLNYAALESGFYSFLCSASIPGCGETGIQKLLTIKIVPPFWMSGWFIAISSLGAILIITLVLFIVMRMNYQRKLRKLKMQQELDKVRARISRDIHDDIGAGLTRIALSGELMAYKSTEDVQQQEKLKWIAGTARELSQSMKEVVWSVNPHYDSLDHMSAYFRSYVAGVAENGDLKFQYVCDENIPVVEVNPEIRRNLLLILKETVSNAVKYSGCTELRLEIRWVEEKFTMKISDNGIGFDPEANDKVNSNGLRNIRQRAEASDGTVKFTSESGKGTTVEVCCAVSVKE